MLIVIVAFASCEKERSKIERTESELVTKLALKFVFLDDRSEDLIEKSNIHSYPITFKDSYTELSKDDIREYQNDIYFNENANTITYNTEINKNVWETIVYGFDNISEFETQVHFEDNSVDTISVKFSFLTDCMGRDYCSEIIKAYYNGIIIYSKDNDAADFIYITKAGNQTKIELK